MVVGADEQHHDLGVKFDHLVRPLRRPVEVVGPSEAGRDPIVELDLEWPGTTLARDRLAEVGRLAVAGHVHPQRVVVRDHSTLGNGCRGGYRSRGRRRLRRRISSRRNAGRCRDGGGCGRRRDDGHGLAPAIVGITEVAECVVGPVQRQEIGHPVDALGNGEVAVTSVAELLTLGDLDHLAGGQQQRKEQTPEHGRDGAANRRGPFGQVVFASCPELFIGPDFTPFPGADGSFEGVVGIHVRTGSR